ncbi:integron integrase [Planctomycetota bacterium]
MQSVPTDIARNYSKLLEAKGIPPKNHYHFQKWLRYYLDFCHKYQFISDDRDSLSYFIRKLHEKNQTLYQQKQASHAMGLYYEMLTAHQASTGSHSQIKPTDKSQPETISDPRRRASVPPGPQQTVSGSQNESNLPLNDSAGQTPNTITTWDSVYWQLKNEIQVRHYSIKTFKTYSQWIHQFQGFVKDKSPQSLSTDDVKAFLTFLAVKRKVAASTQNQALNSVLFMFRHIIKKEFGDLKGTVRAKKRPYIPTVLSQDEIDRVVENLTDPYNLVVQLLYGCGLRLFECLKLRVQDLDFHTGILVVHDGKGKKDRSVPLPQRIMPQLQAQVEKVIEVHEEDLAAGYDGTFLFNQLEVKYKNAAKELQWQWFFPAKTLTYVPDTGEYRRYHLHESHVRKALKAAKRKAQICKRVGSHTFRHSFASHLLQANYDIRTIQELLGHSDVRTTMIYTHTVKSRTLKETKSPLDFNVPPSVVEPDHR